MKSKPKFLEISAGDIGIDRDWYQRQPRERHIVNIQNKFNWSLFGSLTIVQRPDRSYWVNDGAHRLEAARRKFGNKVMVPCMVSNETLGGLNEPLGFCAGQLDRLSISIKDQYNAGLAGGHSDWLAIHSAVRSTGRLVFGGRGRTYFAGVGVLMQIAKDNRKVKYHDILGHEMVRRVVNAAHQICGNQELRDPIVHGVRSLLNTCYKAGVDPTEAIRRISKKDPDTLIRESKRLAALSSDHSYRKEIAHVMRKYANSRVSSTSKHYVPELVSQRVSR